MLKKGLFFRGKRENVTKNTINTFTLKQFLKKHMTLRKCYKRFYCFKLYYNTFLKINKNIICGRRQKRE